MEAETIAEHVKDITQRRDSCKKGGLYGSILDNNTPGRHHEKVKRGCCKINRQAHEISNSCF
jgi:hypothetical protein